MTGQRVTVAPGVTLQVEVHGADRSGTPVVALHDLGSNARVWDAVARRLVALDHPVAAVDLRGHGGSAGVAVADMAVLSADVVAVIDGAGWHPVVAGHGWGANVALEVAVRHPDATRAQVWVDGGTTELVGRFADWPTAEAAEAPPLLFGVDRQRFERGLRGRHPEWSEEAVAGVLASVEVSDDDTVRPRLAAADHRILLRHLWEQRPSQLFGAVDAPILVVPAEDPHVPDARWMMVKRAEVNAAAAALRRVRVHWVPGEHDLPVGQPDAIARLIHTAASPPGPADPSRSRAIHPSGRRAPSR